MAVRAVGSGAEMAKIGPHEPWIFFPLGLETTEWKLPLLYINSPTNLHRDSSLRPNRRLWSVSSRRRVFRRPWLAQHMLHFCETDENLFVQDFLSSE
jgi:hypothetical protein